MSDVQNDTTKAAETPAAEPATTQQPEETKAEETKDETEAPAESSKPEETTDAATETKDEAAAPAEKKDEPAKAEKKPVEPITEGQLGLKGPGLLKSIIPSKKEFWMSDDAVSPQNLNLYMRGEKPEISHPVVAWASQTGKGLLFFNKKGETARKQPGHVIALYDVTDLKKQPPHEITFRLHGQEIVMKATSDNERDGWFMSIEKGVEIAKAQKEEIRESEGYKAELEKLNKPITAVGSSAVAANRGQSQPSKTTEADKTDKADKAEESQRKNSDLEDKKSRSNSRGVLDRLRGKKDETETKKEEKEEKKEESKPAEETKVEEGAAGGAAVAGAAAAEGATSEDKTEDKKETTEEKKVESKPEEKPKPTKRGSIFGKIQGLGGVKSPSKEKEQKDVELKPDVPPKDAPVSENPPQLPEPATETAPAEETTKTETETKPEATEEKKDATTPSKEKNTFLAGIPFINKRNRSVSPSTNMKEPPVKAEEAAPADVPKEPEPVEEGKTDEAVAETTAVEPLKPEDTKAADKENKRQSVLGNIGRRASKAFKGIQTQKKESTAPAASASTKKEETAEAAPAADKPVTNGESKPAESSEPQQQIGDVVPDAVNVGKAENQPPTVTASA